MIDYRGLDEEARGTWYDVNLSGTVTDPEISLIVANTQTLLRSLDDMGNNGKLVNIQFVKLDFGYALPPNLLSMGLFYHLLD